MRRDEYCHPETPQRPREPRPKERRLAGHKQKLPCGATAEEDVQFPFPSMLLSRL